MALERWVKTRRETRRLINFRLILLCWNKTPAIINPVLYMRSSDARLEELGEVVPNTDDADHGRGGGDERGVGRGAAGRLSSLRVVVRESGPGRVALGALVILALLAERCGEGVHVAAVDADVRGALLLRGGELPAAEAGGRRALGKALHVDGGRNLGVPDNDKVHLR